MKMRKKYVGMYVYYFSLKNKNIWSIIILRNSILTFWVRLGTFFFFLFKSIIRFVRPDVHIAGYVLILCKLMW
jgi:hypothetical protein